MASHLADRFRLTLVDLSEPMLQVSRALNPTAAHHQGDMRTVRLGEQFDAVLIHDAIDYMTTEDDLRQAIETAYAHVRPGGIAVLVPDDVAESFEQRTDHGGSDAADGRAARYLEWSWDPDPGRHLDDHHLHLRAPRRERVGRDRARDPPARPVPPRHLAAAADRGRVHRQRPQRAAHRRRPPADLVRGPSDGIAEPRARTAGSGTAP